MGTLGYLSLVAPPPTGGVPGCAWNDERAHGSHIPGARSFAREHERESARARTRSHTRGASRACVGHACTRDSLPASRGTGTAHSVRCSGSTRYEVNGEFCGKGEEGLATEERVPHFRAIVEKYSKHF